MSTEVQNTTSSQHDAKLLVSGSFYRYDAVQYAVVDQWGDFVSPEIPNPKIELTKFNLFKETKKGYWIGHGNFWDERSLKSQAKWVSKTSKKRFAYPTKKEALDNFIKRNEKRIKILKRQLWACEIAVSNAKSMSV